MGVMILCVCGAENLEHADSCFYCSADLDVAKNLVPFTAPTAFAIRDAAARATPPLSAAAVHSKTNAPHGAFGSRVLRDDEDGSFAPATSPAIELRDYNIATAKAEQTWELRLVGIPVDPQSEYCVMVQLRNREEEPLVSRHVFRPRHSGELGTFSVNADVGEKAGVIPAYVTVFTKRNGSNEISCLADCVGLQIYTGGAGISALQSAQLLNGTLVIEGNTYASNINLSSGINARLKGNHYAAVIHATAMDGNSVSALRLSQRVTLTCCELRHLSLAMRAAAKSIPWDAVLVNAPLEQASPATASATGKHYPDRGPISCPQDGGRTDPKEGPLGVTLSSNDVGSRNLSPFGIELVVAVHPVTWQDCNLTFQGDGNFFKNAPKVRWTFEELKKHVNHLNRASNLQALDWQALWSANYRSNFPGWRPMTYDEWWTVALANCKPRAVLGIAPNGLFVCDVTKENAVFQTDGASFQRAQAVSHERNNANAVGVCGMHGNVWELVLSNDTSNGWCRAGGSYKSPLSDLYLQSKTLVRSGTWPDDRTLGIRLCRTACHTSFAVSGATE